MHTFEQQRNTILKMFYYNAWGWCNIKKANKKSSIDKVHAFEYQKERNGIVINACVWISEKKGIIKRYIRLNIRKKNSNKKCMRLTVWISEKKISNKSSFVWISEKNGIVIKSACVWISEKRISKKCMRLNIKKKE